MYLLLSQGSGSMDFKEILFVEFKVTLMLLARFGWTSTRNCSIQGSITNLATMVM